MNRDLVQECAGFGDLMGSIAAGIISNTISAYSPRVYIYIYIYNSNTSVCTYIYMYIALLELLQHLGRTTSFQELL